MRRTIFCYGGCGRSVTLSENKIHPADYYLCSSRQCGEECKKKLPKLRTGMVRNVDMYAAANFWGYTDQIADEKALASIKRAQEIMATGVVKLAIKKAGKNADRYSLTH